MTPQLGDPDNFWSITDIPADCSAPVQLDAFDCAVRNGQTEIADNWRNRNGTTFHMFGNHAVSCNFPCPDGAPDFVYTVPAGTVLGRTQSEADAIAASLCQERGEAAKDCTQPPVELPTPSAWWKMEEAAGNRVDIVNGIPLIPFITTGSIAQGAGKVLFGLRATGNIPAGSLDILMDATTPNIPWDNTEGIEITLWARFQTFTNGNVDIFDLILPNGDDLKLRRDSSLAIIECQFTGSSNVFINLPDTPLDGLYHFFRVFIDRVNFQLGLQIDNGIIAIGALVAVSPSGPQIQDFNLALVSKNAGNPTVVDMSWDEVAIWPRKLTDDEADVLWNNGNGTTWPIP